MRLYLTSIGVLVAAAFCTPAEQPVKYQIKVVNFAPKGKSSKATEKASVIGKVKVTDENGNAVMDTKTEKTSVRSYVEKSLDVDEKTKKQKKYSRAYDKAKDVEGDESETKAFQGRTIVYEKSDDKWKLTAVGKPELSDEDLKELSDEANKPDSNEEALYPKGPVSVGESWKLPGKEVAKLFKEWGISPDTVKGTGKLVKVHKKDGKQWGVIDYVITFKASFGEVKSADAELKATLDGVIDGSDAAGTATFKIKLKGKQVVEKDCKKFTIDLVIDVDMSLTRDASK